MFAARALSKTAAPAVRSSARVAQRRSNQTVPKLGSVEEMEAEAVMHLRARVRRQKEIKDATHHSEAEELMEMNKWIKISAVVATPVCILSMIKDQTSFVEHAHRKPGPMPDYMGIRTKEFPWECENCAIFDLDCWAECRAERAAEAGN